MKPEHVADVLKHFREKKQKKDKAEGRDVPSVEPVPTPVTLILHNGDRLAGTVTDLAADTVMLTMPRVALAHLMKPPIEVFVDVASIQAISEE